MAENENVVWKGRSSQLVNFWPFLGCLLLLIIVGWAWNRFDQQWALILGLIPLAYGGWIWLQTRCQTYELTTERLRVYEGVFNQEINEVELYRVKDTRLLRPLWMRLFGFSTLEMTTSDRSLPVLKLRAIRNAMEVREKLRASVEALRDKKRVREVDFEDQDDEGAGEML